MIKRIINYFSKNKYYSKKLLLCIGSGNKSKKELMRLAYTDSMTGCYNRNALEEHRKIFDSMKLYVTMIDIDGLKLINDTKGHEEGDILIKSVSDYLKTLDALVIRLGGDEFLVLSVNNVVGFVKNASIGITCKSRYQSLSTAMKIADSIMYYDKSKKK